MIIADTLSRPRAIASLLPSDRLLWGILAVIGASLPPWGRLVSVEIVGLAQALAIVAAVLAVRAVYVAARPGARTIHRLLENGASVIAYTAIMAPVSYLCARNSRPLFDHVFVAVDAWLGYDWQAWADFENGVPAISTVLRLAYASLLPQTLLVLVLLPVIGTGHRGFSLIRASLIAVIVACAGSYAMPAAGPDAVHTDWYPDWAALRTGEPFAMVLQQAQGVIAFPSFHATLAILLFNFVRGLGAVTWGFGVLEILMLMSTPTYGHHYLCDVIAGIGVAFVAIGLTSWLDGRFPVRQAGYVDDGRALNN